MEREKSEREPLVIPFLLMSLTLSVYNMSRKDIIKGFSRTCLNFLSLLIFSRTIRYFPASQADRIYFLDIPEVHVMLMVLLSPNLTKAGFGLPMSNCSSSLSLFQVARIQKT